MYSFQPLQTIDTLNSHSGFYFVAFFVFLFVAIFVYGWIADKRNAHNDDYECMFCGNFGQFLTYMCAFFAVLIVSGIISYNTGEVITFKNEKVIGELTTFSHSWHNKNKSGTIKTTNVVQIQETFVTYRLPDNSVVSLPAQNGVSYPERAILYKN